MPLTALGGPTGTVVVGDVGTVLFPQILHPNVFAYIDAQASIGYQMTRTEINAINNLVWGLVNMDLWSRMQVIYPFIGSSLNAQKWNLKDTSTFNITFTGTGFTTSTANGLQKTVADALSYGTTGYTPSVNASAFDFHQSIYVGTTQASSIITPIGAFSSPTKLGLLTGNGVGVFGIQNISSASVQYNVFTTRSTNTGFVIGSRTASNNIMLFINSVLIGSNTTTATSNILPTNQVAIGITTSGAAYPSTQAFRFATIGTGLNPDQARNLSILVQAFNTTLARQV
jgi:hypothetical protein